LPDHGHCPQALLLSFFTTHLCLWPEGLLSLLPSQEALAHVPVEEQHLPTHLPPAQDAVHVGSGSAGAQLPLVHVLTLTAACGGSVELHFAAKPLALKPQFA
jgi:hypothetical protein